MNNLMSDKECLVESKMTNITYDHENSESMLNSCSKIDANHQEDEQNKSQNCEFNEDFDSFEDNYDQQFDDDSSSNYEESPLRTKCKIRGRLPTHGDCEASQYLRNVAHQALLFDSQSHLVKDMMTYDLDSQYDKSMKYPSTALSIQNLKRTKILNDYVCNTFLQISETSLNLFLDSFKADSALIHDYQLHLASYRAQDGPDRSKFNFLLSLDDIEQQNDLILRQNLSKLNQIHLAQFMEHLYKQLASASLNFNLSKYSKIYKCLYSSCLCIREPHSAKFITSLRMILELLSDSYNFESISDLLILFETNELNLLHIIAVSVRILNQDDLI